MVNILSLSGGGYKGVYTLNLLQELQKHCSIYNDIRKHVDVYAGTSVGSIIAAGLACNFTINEILHLIEAHKYKIFHRNIFFMKTRGPGILFSRYRNTALKEVLEKIFGDRKLKDVSKALVITSVDPETGHPIIASSFPELNHRSSTHYEDFLLRDLILASSAAPTFFPLIKHDMISTDIMNEGSSGWAADGGLIANSPELIAITETKRKLNYPIEKIKVLSLGTSWNIQEIEKQWPLLKFNNHKKSRGALGFLNPFRNSNLLTIIMNSQSKLTEHLVPQLIGEENYCRIDGEVPTKLQVGLDSVERNHFLEEIAKEYIHNYLTDPIHDSYRVQKFFNKYHI